MPEEKTIYNLAERTRATLKSTRQWGYVCIGIVFLAAVSLPGFMVYEALQSHPLDQDGQRVFISLFSGCVLAAVIVTFYGNYTIRVELGDGQCNVLRMYGQKSIPYPKIATIEVLKDFTCSHGLYYNFLLLADKNGRELAAIHHTVDKLDLLADDLLARCRKFGAAKLGPNDSDGPGWRGLAAKSARWNRLLLMVMTVILTAIGIGGAMDLRDGLDLFNHGIVTTAKVVQYAPGGKPCVWYKFTAENKKEYTNRVGYFSGQCESLALGSALPVKYRAADPNRSQPMAELSYPYFSLIITILVLMLPMITFGALFIPKAYQQSDFIINGRSYKIPTNLKWPSAETAGTSAGKKAAA